MRIFIVQHADVDHVIEANLPDRAPMPIMGQMVRISDQVTGEVNRIDWVLDHTPEHRTSPRLPVLIPRFWVGG